MTSRYDQPYKRGDLQYFKKMTRKSLVSLVGAPEIGKAKIELRTFSQSNGRTVTASSIDIFMSVLEFEVLCRDIMSGVIARKRQQSLNSGNSFPGPVFTSEGGSIKTMKSRIFNIIPGNRTEYVFQSFEGPGKLNETTGGITPAYKFNEAETKITAGMTESEMRQFAVAGLRYCDFYYEHYFGRIDPAKEDAYGRPLQNAAQSAPPVQQAQAFEPYYRESIQDGYSSYEPYQGTY